MVALGGSWAVKWAVVALQQEARVGMLVRAARLVSPGQEQVAGKEVRQVKRVVASTATAIEALQKQLCRLRPNSVTSHTA